MTVFIVCGVSGSGKSTIGGLLAERLGVCHFDADDFHPQDNIDKMHGGEALDDEDRYPWLQLLADKIKEWSEQGGAVLSCSALKESYRELLGSKCAEIKWIYLHGSPELVRMRLDARQGHFFNTILLDSQFRDLQVPKYAQQISIENTPREIIEIIMKEIANG